MNEFICKSYCRSINVRNLEHFPENPFIFVEKMAVSCELFKILSMQKIMMFEQHIYVKHTLLCEPCLAWGFVGVRYNRHLD